MIGVKYTGVEILRDHPTGEWKPGEIKMFGRVQAIALARERADMEIVEGKELKPPSPPKVKAKKAKGADEDV
jgi:hypothetical protein